MNICTRVEKKKWKGKRKISRSCQFYALLGLTLSVQIEKTSELAFCPLFWINLNLLLLQFLPSILLWLNFMVVVVSLSFVFQFY